eukprot:COSAG04_NODE_2996_length_3295_cov_4.057259_3_plen_160_part_00
MSPGGDIKCITSDSAGLEWSEPRTILTHEADGGVPKVLANKLCVTTSGVWLLPFWREPLNSWLEYSHYHPLQENPAKRQPVPSVAPAAAVPETRGGAASCLISRDRGHTWEVGGNVSDSARRTWLIENSVCESAPGELLMLFRSGEGCIFAAKSTDCGA